MEKLETKRERDSFLRKVALSFKVFKGSVLFGRKGTILWDSYEMWIMQIFLLPPAQIGFFALLASYLKFSTSAIQFVVTGNALQVMGFAAVFGVANITSQDKWQGTLPSLLVSPANRMALFVGRAIFQVAMSSLIVAVGLIYANVLFGVSFASADILGIALTVVITSAAMISFGLLISSIGLYMRTAMIVANIFLFLPLLLSGVNFPISSLPVWLQPFSWVIPMSYGTTALRDAIANGGGGMGSSLHLIAPILGLEILDGLVVLAAGYFLLLGFERLTRKTGKFEEY